MKRKMIVGGLLLSLSLLGACNNTTASHHKNTNSSTATSQKQKTTNSKRKKAKDLNAQTSLSDTEVKRRVIAWFANHKAFKIAEPNKLLFLDAANPTWQEVRGKTILGGQVVTTENERWAVEINTNGECKVFDPLDFNAAPQTFNLFDITQEQLSGVRKDVTKLNPTTPNQANAKGLKKAEINDRIATFYAQVNALDVSSISIPSKTNRGWVDVNGVDIYSAVVYLPSGTGFTVEMTTDGKVYTEAGDASQIPGTVYSQKQGNPTFDIFEVTPTPSSEEQEQGNGYTNA